MKQSAAALDDAFTGHPYLPGSFDAYRREESILILLNIFALLSLVAIDLAFRPYTPVLDSLLVPALLGMRATEQALELIWLWRLPVDTPDSSVRWRQHISIWVNIVFAGLVSILSDTTEAHYIVLLLIPLMAACFRYGARNTAVVVSVCSLLAFVELAVFTWRTDEVEVIHYFEMATTVLIYPAVGAIVWLLAQRMRHDAVTLHAMVDELERTRDRLVAEERLAAVGHLASSVAHEIRNPVAMIVSAIETAKRAPTDAAVQEEFCGIAVREARRLEQLTTDFLSFARTKPPQIETGLIQPALEYVSKLVEPRLGLPGPMITLDCADNLHADFDPFQLHQALLNLLLNAIDHTPASGTITLGARAGDGCTLLYVENTGDPLDEAHVDEIFEPFYTTRTTGTGLGLPISRKIARAHGGDLLLSHNAPGCVRFTITLPTRK